MCERTLTPTSRNAVSYTKVEGEVRVQQWRAIPVDNVSGCDAPKMTQPSLFARRKWRGRETMRNSDDY